MIKIKGLSILMFQGISCFPDSLEENIPCDTVLGALARFNVFSLKVSNGEFRMK